MKKYIKAKELLETKANRKEKKPIYATRKLSIGLVSCMLGLVMAAPMVHAEDEGANLLSSQVEELAGEENPPEEPVEELLTYAEIKAIRDRANSLENDYFFNGNMVEELMAELRKAKADPSINYEEAKARLIDEAIAKNTPTQRAPGEEKTLTVDKTLNPSFDKISPGTKTITGGGIVGRNRRRRVDSPCVISITVKNAAGDVVETGEFSYSNAESPKKWEINLQSKVQVGYKIIATQKLGDNISEEVKTEVQNYLNVTNKEKLKMPSDKIWIEQYVANIVNKDENAEALRILKEENPDIADDIKSVEFKITGVTTKTASYIVTYTDDSKTEEIQAPNLTVIEVTEYSRNADLNKITIVDNVIKGKLEGEGPFDDIKVQLILEVSDAVKDSYCDEGKCLVDKDTSNPVSAVVDSTTGEFSYTITNPNLKIDQVVGVTVKEKNKFLNCSKTTVKPAIPEKTNVKDPRELKDKDKEAIDAAIRKAYTTEDGTSKLPNGTGFDHNGVPAFIEFDKDGNARIISPNNVEFKKVDGKVVYEKNADGSYKVKDETQVITTPAKDLVKNLAPDAPTIAHVTDKPEITITPAEVDTDAKTMSVTYTSETDGEKTITAKKENDKWSLSGVDETIAKIDETSGVITLQTANVKANTKITATVTDNGGLIPEERDLTSEQGEFTFSKAQKVTDLGGLDPVDIKKWVNDTVEWKEGVKVKDSATLENKAKIDALLAEEGTTFDGNTRTTSAQGDFSGKIKVTFDDNSFIEVENQNLYVSDHVSPSDKENLPDDALDVELKLGEGTKVDNTDGDKDNPVSYKKYKVKPNTNLKTYNLPTLNKSVVDAINVTAQDGYTEPVWKNSQNGDDFVATDSNNVFTATATKAYKVTVVPNGGQGTEIKDTKKTGETYKLPAKDTFTPPDDTQEFKAWIVDGQEVAPGTEITIEKDTEVKAIWKKIQVNVSYDADGGSGEMTGKTLDKGSTYKLPDNKFNAPSDKQEFKTWEVDGQEVDPGTEITVNEDTVIKAIWKDIEYKVTFDGNTGTGSMDPATVKKGEKYKLPDNTFGTPQDKQKFRTWEVDGNEVAPGTEITIEKDTVVKAIWEGLEYKVTFNGNKGTGSMASATVKKGEKYKLPDNTFGAPSDKQEFKTWEVDGQEVAPGTEITINKDTEVKAIWKDIEYKVTFNGNKGTGTMDAATVKKGEKYKLPDNTFGAPSDKQEFKAWEVDGKEVAPGTEITIDKDTEVKAVWENKSSTGGSTGDEPTPSPTPNPTPTPTPTPTPEPGKKPNEPKKPDEKDSKKPEDKPTTPEKPADKPAEGDKIINNVVVPVEVLKKDKSKLSPEDRKEIEEKIKEKNPDIVDVKVDEKGNADITFSDGRKERLSAKDLSNQAGIKIPKKHSEDSLSKKAGKNVKTGIETAAGIVCTLVASTGALYIGRKKED